MKRLDKTNRNTIHNIMNYKLELRIIMRLISLILTAFLIWYELHENYPNKSWVWLLSSTLVIAVSAFFLFLWNILKLETYYSTMTVFFLISCTRISVNLWGMVNWYFIIYYVTVIPIFLILVVSISLVIFFLKKKLRLTN